MALHRPLISILFLTCLASLVACATYGFADADLDESAPRLRVETLVAPAHLGLDHPALRTALIDELEFRGAAVVTGGAPAALRCEIVDDRSAGFGDELFAELDLACHIRTPDGSRPPESFRATGQAADAARGEAMALSDTSRATSRAVIDAFRQIAPQVVRYLDEPHRDDY